MTDDFLKIVLGPHRHPGLCWCDFTGSVSADEMLAWLSANCGEYEQFLINVKPDGVLFRTIPAFAGDPRTGHRGDTLEEALVAAVESVHASSYPQASNASEVTP